MMVKIEGVPMEARWKNEFSQKPTRTQDFI